MKLVSTTTGWNVGDDLIREGVFRILGIDPHSDSLLYLNRNRVCMPASREIHCQWHVQRNYPQLNELHDVISAVVLAGTPEWLMDELFQLSTAARVPLSIVGVGMGPKRKYPSLMAVHGDGLLRGATTRDRRADATLQANGITGKVFCDPAFHADYPIQTHDLDVVLTYCKQRLETVALGG